MVSAQGSEMSFGPIGSFIGWMFLPNMVTGWIQTFLYRLFTRAGDPIPPAGSPRYMRDRKYVYSFVIGSYLLFTIYECWLGIVSRPSFYQLFNLPVDADEKMIKREFRKASIKFHPDKVGPNMEHIFVMYKAAYDTLSDPVKRFAYERLGPAILTPDWIHCKTKYDFVMRAAMFKWPNYGGSLIVLITLGTLGIMEFGKFWRLFALFCMFIFDFASVTRDHFLISTKIIHFFTRRTLLPFEQVALGQQVMFSIAIAISQLAPLFQKPKPKQSETMYSDQLDQLMNVAKVLNTESKAALDMEFAPFMKADGTVDRDLKMKMTDWLVERRIESEPELRDAMGRVIEKRRKERGSRPKES